MVFRIKCHTVLNSDGKMSRLGNDNHLHNTVQCEKRKLVNSQQGLWTRGGSHLPSIFLQVLYHYSIQGEDYAQILIPSPPHICRPSYSPADSSTWLTSKGLDGNGRLKVPIIKQVTVCQCTFVLLYFRLTRLQIRTSKLVLLPYCIVR